jgi:hypothetical protein
VLLKPKPELNLSFISSTLDRLTLKHLYWALAAAAAAAIALWLVSDRGWVATWMPNIASELIGALITVAFVDFIIQRQRRPLRTNARSRIDALLYNLLQVVMNQRSRTRTIEETASARAMLDQWIDELDEELPERDWLRYWAANLQSASTSLRSVQDRYDRVLSERMLAALDDFDLWSTRAANEVLWTVSLDNAVKSKRPTPTWTPFYTDHFDAARARLEAVFDAYGAEFGKDLELEKDMWEAARAHRHSQRAGLPIPYPEEDR